MRAVKQMTSGVHSGLLRESIPSSIMKYFLILGLVFFDLMVTQANDNVTSYADEDIDFSLSNLVLTPGNEKNFQYTFNLTNSGTSEVQGYSMKLTFSADAILDWDDRFVIYVPLSDVAAQWIGPNQTLLKTEHYYGYTPHEFLPAGSWYVFAEINYDGIVPETDYTNNAILSTNKITVNDYTIAFTTPPTITLITDTSFTINTFFEPEMATLYYRIQPSGAAAPTKSIMQGSNGLFPGQLEHLISGLGPAFDYDVYFMGEFYGDMVTVIYKIDVTTSGIAAPTLRLSSSEITLEATSKNKDSSPQTYSITGFHLTSNVTVISAGNFVVSADDITYAGQVTFPTAVFDQTNSAEVYVKFLADGLAGAKSENIVVASAGATSKNVSVDIIVFDPTVNDFNGLTALEQTGWSSYSVRGRHTWSLIDLETSSPSQREMGVDKAIQIDGSTDGFTTNEDWLISPEIDLSGFLYDPTIKFRSYSSGEGAPLILKYSADYSGFGDPTVATWFDADAEFPAVNSDAWKRSYAVILNKESNMHFAFVYKSTLEAGTRWTIDDWAVSDNFLQIPTDILSYRDVEVGTSSAAQTIEVKFIGYGDVTITVSEGFQISLDNSSFSASVVIPESDAAAGKTFFVRFVPVVQTQELEGSITFTGRDLEVTKSNLVGSSFITTATARPLESSNFIYPNPTDGAVHVDMNSLYNQQNEVPVLIANNMGATVAQFQSSITSLEIKLSDVVGALSPGLYYITVQGDKATYRNKLIKK